MNSSKKKKFKKVMKIAGTPVSFSLYCSWLVFKGVIIACIVGACLLGGLVGGAVFAYIKTAEPLTADDFVFKNQTSFVYDAEGNVIDELKGLENRILVDYPDLPQDLIDAFVAIEDARFWTHKGVDVKRTLGAVLSYAINLGDAKFGGSTITQQLVKHVTNNWTNSIQRKIQEQWLALQIEGKLSKEQILTSYMNMIYMGSNVYGVQSAALTYFGKSVGELSLAECASIAGITNLPGKYAPIGPITRGYNKERQEIVLAEMLRQGKITKSEYDSAMAEKLAYIEIEKEENTTSNIQSYFVDAAIYQAIDDLMEKYDWSYSRAAIAIYNEGIRLYTTMDSEMQSKMDKVFNDPELFSMNADINDPDMQAQAAMVVLDPYNGYVRALYSGYGEKTGNLVMNIATQTQRQPGSSFKPVAVYAPLIDKGIITAGTVFDDAPVYLDTANPDTIYPTNYETNVYRGLTTIHDAVMYSQNVVAAKAYMLDPDSVYPYLDAVGLNRDDERYISLALGGLNQGTNPLRMAAAYSAFVNSGIYTSPTMYTAIYNAQNEPLIEKAPQTKNFVYSEQTAYIMTDVMSDVSSQNGTAGELGKIQGGAMPTAGKTGTSGEWKDKWFVAYTPYYVGAVWYGYITPTKIPSAEYNMALNVWQRVMEGAHEGLTPKDFVKPISGLVEVEICKCSGDRPSELCRRDPRGESVIAKEYFIKGTEPGEDEICDIHVEAVVCVKSEPDAYGRYCFATQWCDLADKLSIVRTRRNPAYNRKTSADPFPIDWKYEIRALGNNCTFHKRPIDTVTPEPELDREDYAPIE